MKTTKGGRENYIASTVRAKRAGHRWVENVNFTLALLDDFSALESENESLQKQLADAKRERNDYSDMARRSENEKEEIKVALQMSYRWKLAEDRAEKAEKERDAWKNSAEQIELTCHRISMERDELRAVLAEWEKNEKYARELPVMSNQEEKAK